MRRELRGESPPACEEIDPTTGLIATDQCPARRTEYFIEGSQPQQTCEAHSGEHPEQTPTPGFAWPEGQMDIEDRAKKMLRDAEKGIDAAAREMKKQIKKATGKP